MRKHWNVTTVTGGVCGFLTYGELAVLASGFAVVFVVGFVCGMMV